MSVPTYISTVHIIPADYNLQLGWGVSEPTFGWETWLWNRNAIHSATFAILLVSVWTKCYM
jgi:hypothetical protein